MYKLKSNKEEYVTQTKRKYFKYALEYVLNRMNDCKKDEIVNACKVNKINYIFDFEKMVVYIKSNQDDGFYKYSLLKG